MAAFGQCDVRAATRRGAAGTQLRLSMRIDPDQVVALIHELAASIGMRVTLTPAARHRQRSS